MRRPPGRRDLSGREVARKPVGRPVPQPEGDPGTARARDDRRDDGHLRAPVPRCRGSRPRRGRREFVPAARAPEQEREQEATMTAQAQARAGAAGEPACRPGSVHPPTRAGGHPSGTAVAGSLVRSTREHRAGRPQTLAQAAAEAARPFLTLLRVGFTEPPQITRALVVSYTTVSPLPLAEAEGGLLSVALSRGSPRVGVTDHPALRSPDLPHRVSPRRGRPAGSPAAASSIGAKQPFLAGKDARCRSWCALSRAPRHTSRSHTGRQRRAACAAARPAGRAARAAAGSSSA